MENKNTEWWQLYWQEGTAEVYTDFFKVINAIPLKTLRTLDLDIDLKESSCEKLSSLWLEIEFLLNNKINLDIIKELVHWNIYMRKVLNIYDSNISEPDLFVFWLENTLDSIEQNKLINPKIELIIKWYYCGSKIDVKIDYKHWGSEDQNSIRCGLEDFIKSLNKIFILTSSSKYSEDFFDRFNNDITIVVQITNKSKSE